MQADNLDRILIALCVKLCKEADKAGADRDETIENFARFLLYITQVASFKKFKTK